MNQQMTALAIDFEGALRDSAGLDERLADFLARGFVEELSGAIVFSDEAGWGKGLGRFVDESHLEGSVNHIHIDLELADAAPSEIHHQAALFVGRLCEELRRTYPTRAFFVFMTVTDSTIVRFHQDRPGKISRWDDDLDRSERGAVLQLRIGP